MEWGCAVCSFDAVFGGEGDHTAGSEVFGVWCELFGRSAVPSAAEEEDDGGAFVFGGMIFREMGVEMEFRFVDGFINVFCGARERIFAFGF